MPRGANHRSVIYLVARDFFDATPLTASNRFSGRLVSHFYSNLFLAPLFCGCSGLDFSLMFAGCQNIAPLGGLPLKL